MGIRTRDSAEPTVAGTGSPNSPSGSLGVKVRMPYVLPLLGLLTHVLFVLKTQYNIKVFDTRCEHRNL